MKWIRNRRQVIYGLIFANITWLVFWLCLTLWRPGWSIPREAWLTFAVVGIAVTFLYLKSWLMGSRARIITRLGAALIAVNVAIALILQLTLISNFFPEAFRHVLVHNEFGYGLMVTVNDVILAVFAAIVVWATIELLLTEDPIDLTTGEPDYTNDHMS